MKRLIFDIETNGYLEEMDRLHCLSIFDLDRQSMHRFNNEDDTVPNYAGRLEDGLGFLQNAELIVGHNIIKFDIPAIQKAYNGFVPRGTIRDTLVLCRLIWTDIRDRDSRAMRKGRVPNDVFGRHSLEAWGHRLGLLKDQFIFGFERWCREMDDYCEQDVWVNKGLWDLVQSKNYSEEAIELEHEVAKIIWRQEQFGFAFDVSRAAEIYALLQDKREEVGERLKQAFKPWYKKGPEFTPKRDDKVRGYVAGAKFTRIILTEFNPNSRDQIADRLMTLYGWEPKEFCDGGRPEINEKTVKTCDCPEQADLLEYLMLTKRIGQLYEGKEAWMKLVQEDGRIHGVVNSNGARTGRMTHSHPNTTQCPQMRQPWGPEFRSLWVASTDPDDDWVLVGCDAEGLELRMLAHYMARWDNGEYAKAVVHGDKKEGTDAHSINMKALGITDRDDAKTWFYAFIYGAGNKKLGWTINDKLSDGKAQTKGGQLRKNFLDGLPALRALQESVKAVAKRKGYLKGLDGRKLYCPSLHSALNTLLQSAGGLVMKKALVIADKRLQVEAKLKPGVDYEFVQNSHDEWQVQTRRDNAELVGAILKTSIGYAGAEFKLRVPLTGDYKIGKSWAETH